MHQFINRYVEAKLKRGWKMLGSTFHEKVAEAAKNSLVSVIDPLVEERVEERVAAIKEKMARELNVIVEERVRARVAAVKEKLSALVTAYIAACNGHLDDLEVVLRDIMVALPHNDD